MKRTWISLFSLCLVAQAVFAAGAAHANEVQVNIPANSIQTGIKVNVPAGTQLMSVEAESSNGQVYVFVKDGAEFNLGSNDIDAQSDYFVQQSPELGAASLAFGVYSTPALHKGVWHIALANPGSTDATVELEIEFSNTAKVPTDFEVSFDPPSAALKAAWGGADNLDCDTAPWHDTASSEHLPDGTSLGEYRRDLLEDALDKLSTQIHSPIPVQIQACWKNYEDDTPDVDDGYTLAAATGTYFFYDAPHLPMQNTWFAMAPTERLLGHRLCGPYSSVDCSIPEVIVWFNSADEAKHNYNGEVDGSLIRSVTMHEIVHGLGFLSQLDASETTTKDDGSEVDNPHFMKFWQGRNDAYTVNVAYLAASSPVADHNIIKPLASLTPAQRENAVTSNNYLVWNDPQLAQNSMNVLRDRPVPQNYVQLYAPPAINLGSTLSHLNGGVHTNQLMTAYISPSHPETLGLAGPILARVGWNTSSFQYSASGPIPGNWYDPNHDGHGIDLELVSHTADGVGQYSIIIYTYDDDGNPEYYIAGGPLRSGHISTDEVGYPVYDPAQGKETYPEGSVGSISLDFTPEAAEDPACAGRNTSMLALMHWEIRGDSGTWCLSPLVGHADRPGASDDLNGLWNAGAGDSGWGLTVTQTEESNQKYIDPLLFYYDSDNQPRWATPGKVRYEVGSEVPIYELHGYCRTCSKQARDPKKIGTMIVGLTRQEHVNTPSGDNTISIDISGNGRLFQRLGVPMRQNSVPAGQ